MWEATLIFYKNNRKLHVSRVRVILDYRNYVNNFIVNVPIWGYMYLWCVV